MQRELTIPTCLLQSEKVILSSSELKRANLDFRMIYNSSEIEGVARKILCRAILDEKPRLQWDKKYRQSITMINHKGIPDDLMLVLFKKKS